MLLKSITICSLMLSVQSQDPFLSQVVNPDYIYFSDNYPPVVTLSVPTSKSLDTDAIRKIFDSDPQKKKKPTTTVEVEKSTELAFGTSIERVPNDKSNIVNRQTSTPMVPSRETAFQLALERERQYASQFSPNRQIASYDPNTPLRQIDRPRPQTYERPQVSLGKPTVPVPQTSLDRPSIQQITLGIPNYSQERPSYPEISLNRPSSSVAIPQSELSRPSAFQPVPSPPPSPTKITGFNSLLYSVTNFGITLLKNIDVYHSGNVVISPFGITCLLGVLQQGSKGETQEQVTNVLQMTVESTPPAYQHVIEDVVGRKSRNVLKPANNLFIADAFLINNNFKSVAMRSFGCSVTPTTFGRPEEATREINGWVAANTENNIKSLIAPGSLDASTQMVLVNAIYFKGLWEVPFRVESTIPREFYMSNGQVKTANFMRTRRLFKTGTDRTTNAKIIVLPFEHNEYHLMVILPSQMVGMRTTLSSLTDARLLSYLSFVPLDTELELPKFTVRADTDLRAIMRTAGIIELFTPYAELQGIGSYRDFSPHITSAVHSAVLSIDEQGGTAAAATAFAAVALSYDDPAVVYKANRPFIAVLWDTKSSLPLFMAKIEDPQQ